MERVRDASARVAAQSDETIRTESRRLGPLLARFLEAAGAGVVPGATTQSICDTLAEQCRHERLEPAMLGYNGYPAAAAVSVNEEIVHGVPSARVLDDGDVVKVEFGVVSGKAFAAQSWTFCAGNADDADVAMMATGRKALRAAVAAVSPSGRLGDIGAAIQSTTEAAGLSVVRSFLGYGMGKQRIQAPQVSGVGERATGMRMRPGLILNIHVIIKRGSFDVDISPNEWTALAADGLRGALFTSMVEVTPKGHLELTREVDAP
jgi:methionyl aminopeptidase